MFYGTGIPAALLIINKNKPAERKGKVLFINGELEYEEAQEPEHTATTTLSTILSARLTRTRIRNAYSRVVDIEEIRDNDYNLISARYADTTPPPEQFDVNAVLNGGIPVTEVEDEYIQETLNGMDVSVVFTKKDDDYYEFNTSIETKDQIGEVLGDVDQAVVDQFERWWDKYRVSLREVDEQVRESEERMWGFLKELGYD